MASVIEPPKSQKYVDFDEYVDLQLQKARDGIRTTDILTAVMMFAVGVMVWLLLFVILDHWVVQDGIGPTARIAMAVVFGIVSLGWLGWKVAVPYLYRVNRLFAAKQIERTQPELKSTLLNLVDLQDDGRELPSDIQMSLQRRAAESMARTDVETAIDRRPLMISVYAFCVLIVVFLLYSLFTPKPVSSSVWRAILPTSDIAAPTETVIKSVLPGDAEVVPGTRLPIEVEISGETPDAVELVYTTSDRAFVDEVIPLRTDETMPGRFVGDILGVNGAGIQQSLTYRIVAGDARSPEYTVAVHQPPSAQVTEIRRSHPEYMKHPAETQSTGNIDDYEGTTVTIRVTANMPLQSAVVTFSDDNGTDFGAENVPLRAVGKDRREFQGRWMLSIADDGVFPTHYHIDVRNDRDERDPSPTRYDIAVRPDERPEIRVIRPRDPVLERPANAILPLRFTARDDFAVHLATLWKQKNDEQPRVHRVVFEGFEKAVTAGYEWRIGEGPGWSVKPGDRITWWIEARDNNTLRPGRKNSEKRVVVITEPVDAEEVEKQLEEDRRRDEGTPQNDPKQSDDPDQNSEPQPGEQQDSELTDKDPPQPDENANEDGEDSEENQSDGQPGEKGEPSEGGEGGESQDESVANDGSEDGEALKELVERFREQQEQKQDGTEEPDPQNPDQKPNESDEQPSGDNKQPSDSGMPDSENQPGESSEDQQPKDGNNSDQPNENQQPNSENQPSEASDAGDDESKPKSDKPNGANNPDSSNKPSGDNSTPGGNESSEAQDDPGNMPDGNDGTKAKPSTENKKPGDVTDGDRVPDDGKPKPTDTADQPVDGDSTESEDMTGDPNTEEKPSSDAMGDGTGEEKPTDQEPNPGGERKPTSTDQEPGENGRKTDRDPDGREGNPDSKPADTDAAKGEPGDKQDSMDSADRPRNGDTDDSERPAEREGDADAGEDELKGDEPPKNQKSDRPEGGEKGSSKQNQEGQPGSKETGPGDKSDTPGDKDTSEKPNGGEASDETGKGSSERTTDEEQPTDGMGKPTEGESGSESDSEQPMNNGGEAPQTDPKSGEPSKPSDANQDQKPGNAPTGSDRPDGDQSNGASETGTDQDPKGPQTGNGGPQGRNDQKSDEVPNNAGQGSGTAEQPNLEDSKQAADFVLKKLEDDLKRGQVDEDWLEKMGWTDQDAAKFLDRMKQRQNPSENSPQSQAQRRQYEEWLKQIKPKGQSETVRRRGSAVRNRADREIISAPPADAPAAIRNLYEEYLQGIAKRRERLND
ncbi:hypothetical protein [Thalassoroseus pseudoceratinae]|uniref:hypothetical protein n=1 Tax=Thalassoroseus pseudoceratinae TaxID=2713176 RepID=UPI0014234BE6|nr:hypothetical protein [Thalassoroseus pseudoceratinae]